jgi:hypothetical protein
MNPRSAVLCLLPILLLLSACGLPGFEGPAQAAVVSQSATVTRRPPALPTATLTPTASPTPPTLQEGGPLSLTLPDGYYALQSDDGGVFVYHETPPGFLILYRTAGDPAGTLTRLLNDTRDVSRTEPPLEVEIGGRTFAGLFVETRTGDRLFLAAAEDTPTEVWTLVVQGPAEQWPALAAGFNQVLLSLTFEEDDG